MDAPPGSSTMRIVDWVLSWVLWIARLLEKVLMWGLSMWAYMAALLCIAIVLSCHWVALTLSNGLTGLNSSIFGYVPSHPQNSLVSWGVLASLLFAVSAWTYSRKHWRTLALVGAALLLMCLAGLLQLAYGEPILMKRLADEEAQVVAIQRFQNSFLPVLLREEESNSSGPAITANIQTAWDRAVVARYFMGSGWYLALVVGLLAFFYARARLSARDRSRATWGAMMMAVALVIGFSWHAVVAHVLVAMGQVAEVRGDTRVAIQRYRLAMRLDGWFASHTALYQRIGAIDANFGRVNTLDYGIFLAERRYAQGNFVESIGVLEKLTPRAGTLAAVLRVRESQIWTEYGYALYKAHAIAAAIPAWQTALARDPTRWYAGFCLSRAYFEAGRYDEAITLTQRVIKAIRDPVTIAQLDCNLGDSLTRTNELQQAHIAYRQSYLLDYVYNWRGLTGVVGAQSSSSLQDSDQLHGKKK